jgi:hypothetical protein
MGVLVHILYLIICRFELQPPKNKGGCNQVHILQPQPPLRNLPVATPGCNNLQPNTTQVATNSYNHLALIRSNARYEQRPIDPLISDEE